MEIRNKRTGEVVDAYIAPTVEGVRVIGVRSLAELNEKWEDMPEEVEEDKWPQIGDIVYLATDDSPFTCGGLRSKAECDELNRCGLLFKTEAEAQKRRNWLEARKVLLGDTNGYHPIKDSVNWHIYYDFREERFRLQMDRTNIYCELVFRSGTEAQKSVVEHRREWLIFLGVEEGDE